MDMAAFKVGHSYDIDATALQAVRESEVKLHGGDGTLHVGLIHSKAHPLPHTHTWRRSAYHEGAMNLTCMGSIRQNSQRPATTHQQQ